MKRPKKEDYIICNQFEFDNSLKEYYKALELYVTYIEDRLDDLEIRIYEADY